MNQDRDETEVRRELAEVEQLIASVRRDMGENVEETPDAADAGAELTEIAEDQAVLASLEARRDRLRERLEG